MMGVTGYRNNGKAFRNNNVIFAWNKFKMTKVCPGDISTAGTMDFHEFAKPPRMCNKLKTAAPVHNNCSGNCEHVLRT